MSPQILITYCNNNNNSLSPNVFDESPLIFQAKKDNFLKLFGEVDITCIIYVIYVIYVKYIIYIHYTL